MVETVMIWMGAEVTIEVMEMMELKVVGAYVLGVEMEPPIGVGWVLALRLGAWSFSGLEAKNGDMDEVVRLLVHGVVAAPWLPR